MRLSWSHGGKMVKNGPQAGYVKHEETANVFFLATRLFWVVVSNIVYFHPDLGKLLNLTHIFQMDWKHQPVLFLLVGDVLRILPWQITIFHHHVGNMFGSFSKHQTNKSKKQVKFTPFWLCSSPTIFVVYRAWRNMFYIYLGTLIHHHVSMEFYTFYHQMWSLCNYNIRQELGDGFKYCLFSPLPGEMIQFDSYSSGGLKPPTIGNMFGVA